MGLVSLQFLMRYVLVYLVDATFRVISKTQLINTVNDRGIVVGVEFSIGTKQWKIVRDIQTKHF